MIFVSATELPFIGVGTCCKLAQVNEDLHKEQVLSDHSENTGEIIAPADYPAIEELDFTGETIVDTARPERYAKQLASHFSAKLPSEDIEYGTRLTFNRDGLFTGYADVLVEPIDGVDHLKLAVYAADAEKREKLAAIVGGHLERFGERDQLEVHWEF
ncbi:DUF2218 domain-containing protein [Rothia terrae]|nr:DUF2218 domain-containing protein [Rothia terrae]